MNVYYFPKTQICIENEPDNPSTKKQEAKSVPIYYTVYEINIKISKAI